MLAVCLHAFGCNRPKGVHPDPVGAGTTCRRAIAESERFGPNGRTRHALSGCKALYSQPDCRDAVQEYAEWQGPRYFTQMLERCAAAYCPRLEAPLPALCDSRGEGPPADWVRFNERVLKYELGANTYAIGQALDAYMEPGRSAIAPFTHAAVRPSPPVLEVRVVTPGEATRVRLVRTDGGETTWETPWKPDANELEAVRDALAAEQSPSVSLRAERQVMFLLVRALMVTSVDAGAEDILFSTLD